VISWLWLTAIQKNSLGKVSFTTDMWSDPDLKPYMAVTAHWLENVQSPCHGSDGKVPDSAVMTTRAGSILVMDYS
jgi:hypothetical protein